MKQAILVGAGGFIGSVCRYWIGALILHHFQSARLPCGTLAVNLLGCLLIGVLGGIGEKYQWFHSDARLFLITGCLGGFTTFSAFGLETYALMRGDKWMLAGLNVGASVIGGLLMVWLGFKAADLLPQSPTTQQPISQPNSR